MREQLHTGLRSRVLGTFAAVLALSGGLPAAPAVASYPGTPGRIIFLRHGDAWTVPSGGGKATQLLWSEPNVFNFTHSPDGRRVAFEAWAGQPYVMVMRRDGANVRNVTRNVARCRATGQPTWSADGSRLAFVCLGGTDRRPTTDLYSIRPDGSGLRRITDVAACCISDPAWAPRGRRIAYLYGDGIFLVPAGGGQEQRLRGRYTDERGVIAGFRTLDWSPDGTRLVTQWTESIRIVDATTGAVGPDLGRGDGPVFSPDGRRIAFSGVTDDGHKIWTMAADGSDRRRITGGVSEDHQPDWSVRP